MKRLAKLWPLAARSIFALALLAFAVPAQAEEEGLAVGDKAPDFTLMGSDGKEHKLSDILEDQGAVLAWFPMAFTPG